MNILGISLARKYIFVGNSNKLAIYKCFGDGSLDYSVPLKNIEICKEDVRDEKSEFFCDENLSFCLTLTQGTYQPAYCEKMQVKRISIMC